MRLVANETMNGATARLAGFLVPDFGACIHVPPPPANQIIHVVADPPAKGMEAMEAVWVEGTLQIALSDSDMGRSSYRMKARAVSKYKK